MFSFFSDECQRHILDSKDLDPLRIYSSGCHTSRAAINVGSRLRALVTSHAENVGTEA